MRKHLVWILLVTPSLAQTQPTAYSNAEYHYSLQLPENWKELPADQVRQAGEAVRKGMPQLSNLPTYDAWFQLRNRPDYAYPYVVVNHQRCRPPTLAEIQAMAMKDKAAANKKLDHELEGFSEGSLLGQATIDTRLHAVLIPLEQTVLLGDIGPVVGEMALFPGRQGIVPGRTSTQKGRESRRFPSRMGKNPRFLPLRGGIRL